MNDFKLDNFIKNHSACHNALYCMAMVLSILLRVMNFTENTGRITIFCLVLLVIMVADIFLFRIQYFGTMRAFYSTKFIELFVLNAIEPFIGENSILVAAILAVLFVLSVEFVVYGSDYDKSTCSVRKMFLLGPLALNAIISFRMFNESIWVCYIIAHAITFVVVYFIVDWMVLQNEMLSNESSKLRLELSHVETDNEKLLEYQEKVKAINEQINYQKIDLARAIKNLKQTNTEMASQTELLRYMASTFDILKCINVMADAVMEVKKAKICAIYIDKDVYMNKQPSLVIKTNYTSMDQRLKKEMPKIYEKICAKETESMIIGDSELEQYNFVGDSNLKNLAILPMMGTDGIYGLMLVGSNTEDFFDSGLNYYESCVAELAVSIKSAVLYLKTQDMARKDGLTGIYNRLYFNELIGVASRKAVENNTYLSVALFDIDKFKLVNDTYGHLTGDEVIKMVASVANKYAEKYKGFACRYGGEEFLLVLPDYNENDMLKVLEEMHSEIKGNKVSYKDTTISINVCIGFSTYPTICKKPELLVSRADKAMYYGKEHGRGRLVMDNPEIDETE